VMLALTAAWSPLTESLRIAADLGQLHEGDAVQRSVIVFSAVHGLLQLRKQVPWLEGMPHLDTLVHQSLCALLVGWGGDPSQLAEELGQVVERGPLVSGLGGNSWLR